MPDLLNAHDLLHAGVSLFAMAVTIAVIKNDVRWIRKWCDDHQKADDACFEQARTDIRELRTAMREDSRR
jgi:hypothetical protein